MAKTTNPKENNVSELFINGRVVRAYYGTSRKDTKEKNRITIHSEDMPYQDITAFDGSASRYIPSWFKDQEGYMNLASEYDIPVKAGGVQMSFEEWITDTDLTAPNSIVTVKIRQKQGAIYPVAIMVREDGHVEDPFAGFDK